MYFQLSLIFKRKLVFLFLCLIFTIDHLAAQNFDPVKISGKIAAYKIDERGPYQSIRWFCPDGTILPPKERCPEPGGIQHALLKDEVIALAKEQHIFFGQILAGTGFEEFLDSERQHSRTIQYLVEKYLQTNDDGWIMRRGRYYRGAIQAEDEEFWGRSFILWLLGNEETSRREFFIVREIIRDIPHREQDDRWQQIRGISKTISDSLAAFMDVRVKIHGQPDKNDVQRVEAFLNKNGFKLSDNIKSLLHTLIDDLNAAYKEEDINTWRSYLKKIPENSEIYGRLSYLVNLYGSNLVPEEKHRAILTGMADLIWSIRIYLQDLKKSSQRLVALDLSIDLENAMYKSISAWEPRTLYSLLQKNFILAKSSAGCGYLEIWEWNEVEPLLDPDQYSADLPLKILNDHIEACKRVLEWGTAMVRITYSPVINIFSKFESLAEGFLDNRIRSSILLAEGETAGQLSGILSKKAGIRQSLAGIDNTSQVRGVNPGFALGELVVVTGDPEKENYSPKKIYIFEQTPVDLKPVAGIATVSEGNLVSHIQLLARNLGIPNAVLSKENIGKLAVFDSQRMFYAVSPAGTVVLKPEEEMTAQERDLVKESKRRDDRFRVPTDKIDLKFSELKNLDGLRADDSGVLCGPKAANLGELKFHFPDHVVNGFIIPFGIFKDHMDQLMPGQQVSYWAFLKNLFKQADIARAEGQDESEIEIKILSNLMSLRGAIKKMPFSADFIEKLEKAFLQNFGNKVGQVPVFVRSDTNMEDLRDFTGAGLNLTVFNVRDEDKILQGIRDVWASPYAERSYRWRQKYLLDPENVYPSILIIPAVNVDKSGVMVTTGIFSGEAADLTIAFNRGAGGAVEGQLAESYSIRSDRSRQLLSPSRERFYTDLPGQGGIDKIQTYFNIPIMHDTDFEELIKISSKILINEQHRKSEGPVDIELGFKDNQLWLFQIRPFVESKKALSSLYLKSLDPDFSAMQKIKLNLPL